MRNKGVLYKSSAGIPFIISHPDKIKQGNIVETPYTKVDFSPSILSLAGISVDDSHLNIDGMDFSNEVLLHPQSHDNNSKQQTATQHLLRLLLLLLLIIVIIMMK